jgi:D-3-phosphoglycerate dehydrogenase
MSFKILITEKLGKPGLDRLDTMEDILYDIRLGLTQEALLDIIPEYDALIGHSKTRIDARLIAAGIRLKVIGRSGNAVDNVDIAAATQHGILVTNTPHAHSVAMAEHTMALILAAVRHTVQAHNSLAAGIWDSSRFLGTELWCKTLGVIGLDYVGRLVTQRAQSFGMNVVAYDPCVTVNSAAELDVSLMSLEELLAQSDVITLHTAVPPEKVAIINAHTISAMKDGVVIVNVTSGLLIDEPALAAALQTGKVWAAALDVFHHRPPPYSPLIGLPNVIHTPYLSQKSQEGQRRVAVEIVQQVVDALRGVDYRHIANPSAIPSWEITD